MRPLPSELLRSFVVVAQTGSFTVASEQVSLSQSTVSQHIRRLEDLVGQPLFERDTRNVRLSPQGETLHRYAERILSLMDEAMTSLCGPPLNGTVRVGLPEDFASTRLTTALASFVQRNPEVELIISTGMSGDLFRELDEGRHDLVFAKRLSGSQRGTVVRTEPLYWCGSPTSPLNGGESIIPLAVHPEPSIARRRIFEALKAVNRPYRLAIVSSNVMVIQAAVMAGLGISAFAGYVIPEGLVRLDQGLPELGVLEYVIDRQPSVSQAALALEMVLTDAANEL
ncbi:LysR substrate-binding domain-containing protein [Rhodanobacter sp. MP1X3]|jgi:DNA-binding transcriptional LysR family regulator|uniref:LysR family transcriptional regulator n=1 Tax=Rhodanobacter sp. MP1X3 TaxID=2723086 RepID=UPI001617FF5E|nr:LysR substrate-binding domain-containing protein [Rhodanobacter sp. MP1X3]MBB6242917.1 DNA-binding transcriptional LysR family regulator [Rhodanobacter sp. MP1X3]